jgi:uncharacterized membrane protein
MIKDLSSHMFGYMLVMFYHHRNERKADISGHGLCVLLNSVQIYACHFVSSYSYIMWVESVDMGYALSSNVFRYMLVISYHHNDLDNSENERVILYDLL